MERSVKAYKTEQSNLIYNLLFCDDLSLYKESFKGGMSRDDLEKIVSDPKCESRIKILAYNELRRLGVKPEKKELLGVVVEVGMKDGLDTLAAYADCTARYINYTEKMIVWENAADAAINNKIIELIQKSEQIVSKIGPWDKSRLPQPKNGYARLTFLVSDGLYFGQGGFDALLKDPLGGTVLRTASELMNLLVNKSLNK